MMKITRDIEGLEKAAREILGDNEAHRPIVEGIIIRKKWKKIQDEYQEMKKSMVGHKARRYLAKKYFYSEKTIETIIYCR